MAKRENGSGTVIKRKYKHSTNDPKTKMLRGGLKTDAGKDRAIPVHPKILPIIERWYNASTGPLYPRPDGKAYNKGFLQHRRLEAVHEVPGAPG